MRADPPLQGRVRAVARRASSGQGMISPSSTITAITLVAFVGSDDEVCNH
jgi:hypothetical protein